MSDNLRVVMDGFNLPGTADFILGGQWGSEGKGAAAAHVAAALGDEGRGYDVITTNAGAQAGHTSTHNGVNRVVFHLPTAALIQREYACQDPRVQQPFVYLNAGSIIDPDGLKRELDQNDLTTSDVGIHPNAAVITDECREAENDSNSAQTKIASTRKGVGQALSRKVLRSGMLAKDHPYLSKFVGGKGFRFNNFLSRGARVLVEVPQGIGLSIDGQFYPHCTSRNCTVQQAMSDAGIHPTFYGSSMLVLRTYPIRVGNIVENGAELGKSGGHYPDQKEIAWDDLKVKAEITTVTKRVRRVFTFSYVQMAEAIALTRPRYVYLTFCDYLKDDFNLWMTKFHSELAFMVIDNRLNMPKVLYQFGPTTDDVKRSISYV